MRIQAPDSNPSMTGMAAAGMEREGPALRPGKIGGQHLERLAMVYIRQSTPQQLIRHQESKEVQYQLRFQAEQWGWPADRVEVIDEDLGQSGRSVHGRPGFQRLVTEVSLDHVGLILGVEMSRLARSCRDWYQLLDVCAVFGTLIADLDGVYDPAQYNDRLLLGLKGTMSEAELHILQQRLVQGKLNKARKGELLFPLPIGYVRRVNGQVGLDPDEQVQGVVRLVFDKFQELGTVHATLLYLVEHQLPLGVRIRGGEHKGELEWRRPNRVTLLNLLKNPLYAGAYAYGRRKVDARRKIPGRPSTGRTVVPAAQCEVLLKDRFPAYISWERYEQNQQQLRANRAVADAQGAVRGGPALLSGLLICGRCGHRMTVHYTASRHSYSCSRLQSDYGEAFCQSLAGPPLDAFVAEQVLAALQPAGLEVSLEAARHLEQERAQLESLWQQRLERARYDSGRAARQYRLVEPENRLVARSLEREWEAKLAAQKQLEEDYDRFHQQQPRGLSEDERTAIRQLAADIPALWHDPQTTAAERKEILRQVVDRIHLDVIADSERVRVDLYWAGGHHSQGETRRPVARLAQLSYYPALCDRLRQLVAQGLDAQQIAVHLNQEGWRPPKRCAQFSRQGVARLRQRLGLRPPSTPQPDPHPLGPHHWWLQDLAGALDMPAVTLYSWVRRGWAQGSQSVEGSSRWVLWADEAELARLRQRRAEPVGRPNHHHWLAKAKDQK